MKKILAALFIIVFSFGSQTEGRSFYRYGGGVTFNYFYYSLAPYGEWIQIDNNLIVWKPEMVGMRWSPYSVGRWVWTDYGWYWDSYEPFGWATYHYGRWIYDDYYGWVWVPGYRWAPAWVEWRYDDYYIGWAPLPPYASFDIHIGIHFSFGWRASFNYWHFVPYNNFYNVNVVNYFISYDRVRSIFPRTRYRTNYIYRDGRIVNYGVDRNYVQRRSGVRIRKARLRITSANSAVRNGGRSRGNVVTVFRPDKEELNRTRNIRSFKFKKAERTSIVRNKVVVGRKSEKRVRSSVTTKRRIENNSRELNRHRVVKPNGNLRIYRGESRTVTPKRNEKVYRSNRSVIHKRNSKAFEDNRRMVKPRVRTESKSRALNRSSRAERKTYSRSRTKSSGKVYGKSSSKRRGTSSRR